MNRLQQLKRSGRYYRRKNQYYESLIVDFLDEVTSTTSTASSQRYQPAQISRENLCEAHADLDENVSSSQPPRQHIPEITTAAHSEQQCSYVQRLRQWALRTNQTHEAVNGLLEVLRSGPAPVNLLPRSARTLLKTSRTATLRIYTVPGGKFWYKGIKKSLVHVLRKLQGPINISLNVNIDGMSVFRSSTTQFWPMLINIHEMPKIGPIPIAIFCGQSKPSSPSFYLTPLANELRDVINNGLCINGHAVTVSVRTFICDAPARAFIKGVVNFNAIAGCLKCQVDGTYSYETRTVVFPAKAGMPRTDPDFRRGVYGRHHRVITPMKRIPNFDLVEDVTVADRLHLIELGVVKKLLNGWVNGKLGNGARLNSLRINEISSLLVETQLPTEIHRKQRSLNNLNYWKGSEFGSFLHYSSLVVLDEDVLAPHLFEHFLSLFCAITMFSSVHYKPYWKIAGELLDNFVSNFDILYGPQYITSNVHNLLHVAREVYRFGPLNTLSTYPFESASGKLKTKVRHGWRILEQVINRISEIEAEEFESQDNKPYPHTKIIANRRQLHIKENWMLEPTRRNAFFLSKDDRVFQVSHIENDENGLRIHAHEYLNKTERFDAPLSSFVLNIYVSNKDEISNNDHIMGLSDIKCKLVALDYKNDAYVFIPLVHTFLE